MVTVPVRVAEVWLALAVTFTLELPVPDFGDSVIHDALALAVHWQLAVVVMDTFFDPPPPAGEMLVGDTLKEHDTPACVTLTVCPPMVTLAVRDELEVFAEAVTAIDPFPLPLAGLTVIHPAPDEAVQEHPAGRDAATVLLAPPATKDSDVGDREVVHGIPACVTVTV